MSGTHCIYSIPYPSFCGHAEASDVMLSMTFKYNTLRILSDFFFRGTYICIHEILLLIFDRYL